MRELLTPEVLPWVTPVQVVIVAFIVVALVVTGFWLLVLIDLLSWPATTWDASGLSRARWFVRILLLGSVGAVWYVRSPRPQLKSTYAAIRWGTGTSTTEPGRAPGSR